MRECAELQSRPEIFRECLEYNLKTIYKGTNMPQCIESDDDIKINEDSIRRQTTFFCQ